MNQESRIKNKIQSSLRGSETTVAIHDNITTPWIASQARNDGNRRPDKKTGFSLFELIVVISIVAVVTAITFNNFPKMNSKLSLDLLAQDIALTIRQAQVFGTTVFGAGTAGAPGTQVANFNSYGVSFPDPTDETAKINDNYTYTLFVDITQDPDPDMLNGYYNHGTDICLSPGSATNCVTASNCGSPSGTNECFQRFQVTGRDKVAGVCYDYLPGTDVMESADACLNNPDKQDLNTSVEALFTRPSLQANLSYYRGTTEHPNNIAIVVENEEGTERRAIVVWKNGQIAVDR